MSSGAETPSDVTSNPDSLAPTPHAEPPAKSQESPLMPIPATQSPVDTPREQIAAVPSAHPSAAPNAQIASNGAASVAASASSADRTWLVAGGLILGFVGLMALAAVWLIRRRYSDPLVR
jgi:uncharacterized membrane protein